MGLIVNDVAAITSSTDLDDQLVHVCPRWNPDLAFCGKDMTGSEILVLDLTRPDLCVVCLDIERGYP